MRTWLTTVYGPKMRERKAIKLLLKRNPKRYGGLYFRLTQITRELRWNMNKPAPKHYSWSDYENWY